MADETEATKDATETTAPTLEQTMEAAFDAAQEEPAEEVTQETGETEDAPADEVVTEEATTETTEETTEDTSDHREEVEAEPETEPAISAPASWSPAAQDEWTSLPPAIQQEVLKRESDIQKGMQQSAERLKGTEGLEQALEPVRQSLELNGVSAAQYVKQLVAAEGYLRTNPAEAIKWFMKSYGVQANQLSPPEEVDEFQDPQVSALQKEITELKTVVAGQAEADRNKQAADVQAEIETFRASPGHEHFEAVREYMGVLMDAGKAQDMQTAYDMAVWADPTVREKVRASERTAEEQKRKKAAAEKAKEARKAAGTNLSSTAASGGSTPKAQTMEEGMGEIFDRMQGA